MIRTDVDVLLCTSLDARSADGLCKFLGLFLRHLSIYGVSEVRHGINGEERQTPVEMVCGVKRQTFVPSPISSLQ